MKALTGIALTNDFGGTTVLSNIAVTYRNIPYDGTANINTTNGDRAGHIYSLLTNYNRYPAPALQSAPAPGTGWVNLSLTKDTPGLAYSVQSTADLASHSWQDLPGIATDSNTTWSTSVELPAGADRGFLRLRAAPAPATSPPWPPQ